MQEDLYLSYYLTELSKSVIIEGDGITVWVYVLKEDEETVDFGGFLCATGQPIDDNSEIERYLMEGNQPPLHQDYANEHSVVENLQADDIGVEVLGTDKITVSIRKKVYLILDLAQKQSHSIALSQDGPYGMVLGE
ncbi:hypothetical protein [Cesiribacter andamanensis]|uniref:Uncharacterized protein n=1 Tax=Cesiribacter andamanensis AMV16 TaxID=1279009 RepID=M7N208_9BACT|nr:hypothetical protein [Cesiribacter andamanensis]EMR01332.1 hypothetical protein ADICEAN_03536 [Cesiribacter andamanensis AMV16]